MSSANFTLSSLSLAKEHRSSVFIKCTSKQ